jgi:transposase
MSPEQRYVLRQRHPKPLMAEFKRWIYERYPTVPPKSSLGKAFSYTIRFLKGLSEFLNDGRLDVNNHSAE